MCPQEAARVPVSQRCKTNVREPHLPNTHQANENVFGESVKEHLTDNEYVRGEGALKHDGHVAGVEQLDRVGHALSTEAVAFDGNLNAAALKIDDRQEDNEGR